MPRAIQAVVFDLDDTLYAERQFAFSGFAVVAQEYQDVLGDPLDAIAELKRLFDSPNRHRVFDALLLEKGRDPDPNLVRKMVTTYRKHSPKIDLHADAARALDRLQPMVRLGLISDGPASTQQAKFKALGLESRFRAVLFTAAWSSGYGKPHPFAFERMAQELGVDPKNCAYVADNAAKDFIAPNVLGWTTIQIRREDGIYRDTPSAPGGRAQHVIDSLDELDRVLFGNS
ncbi:MAG: HAD family hydrolase [Planctomycetota bacterium]